MLWCLVKDIFMDCHYKSSLEPLQVELSSHLKSWLVHVARNIVGYSLQLYLWSWWWVGDMGLMSHILIPYRVDQDRQLPRQWGEWCSNLPTGTEFEPTAQHATTQLSLCSIQLHINFAISYRSQISFVVNYQMFLLSVHTLCHLWSLTQFNCVNCVIILCCWLEVLLKSLSVKWRQFAHFLSNDLNRTKILSNKCFFFSFKYLNKDTCYLAVNNSTS